MGLGRARKELAREALRTLWLGGLSRLCAYLRFTTQHDNIGTVIKRKILHGQYVIDV